MQPKRRGEVPSPVHVSKAPVGYENNLPTDHAFLQWQQWRREIEKKHGR